jgi:DNA-binding NtrC family response regulator
VGGPPGGRERRRHDISPALLRDGWARVKVEEAPREEAAPPAGPARILLVDDDLVVLEMLRDILREEGFAPRVTADPREAVAWLGAGGFDLVITDMVMPHMDGLHLVEEVKTRSPQTAVILMSAFKTDQLVSDAFRRGASAFITKPFEMAPFIATIREMVASRAR